MLTKELKQVLCLCAIACVVSFVLTDVAHAQAFNRIESILNNIKSAMTGTLGRSIAIIGVMLVGLAWVFGQMDIKRAGVVIVGIGIIFGAAEIVAALAG